MLENQFSYRILHYVHSEILGEILNVGILFNFNSSKKLIFKTPISFKKLKDVYSDFEEYKLKLYLKAIEYKINSINYQSEIELFPSESKDVSNEIINKDSSVLQFGELRYGLVYASPEIVAKDYYNLYFSEIKEAPKRIKHDEQFLLKEFKSKLHLANAGVQNYLEPNIEISSSLTTIKFEYKWQNGVPNLIKSVSFDLDDEKSINNKAVLLHGQLNFLAEKINENNCNVDLIVAKPTSNIDALNRAYDKAISILEKIETSKKIHTEEQISEYAQHVADGIKPPPSLK